jgi:hypothetical protein
LRLPTEFHTVLCDVWGRGHVTHRAIVCPPRVQAYQLIEVMQARQNAIDSLEESRDITITRSVGYQQTLQ